MEDCIVERVKSYIDELNCEAGAIADTMDLVLSASEYAICRGDLEVSKKAVSALNLIANLLHEHEAAFSKLFEMLSGEKAEENKSVDLGELISEKEAT